jgi:phage terminase large subunit
MAIIQTFNEIYEPMFHTNRRYIDLVGGRGRGGSHTGTDFFLHKIVQPEYFRGYFIRQNATDIRDSLFRDFTDRLRDNKSIRQSDFRIKENEMDVIHVPTGNMIMSKGVKKEGARTAKMKSLAGATHALIEEADELGEDDFDQLDISLRTTKGKKIQILRIFNPPHKAHWIWRDYVLTESDIKGYFNYKPKSTADIEMIFGTYLDNIENISMSTRELFENFKRKKPEYYYTVIKGLVSEGMRGRVFSNWQAITQEEYSNIDARSIIGLDFGGVTGGCVESKLVRNRRYVNEIFYGGGTAKELAIRLCIAGIKDELIIADSAEPTKIAELHNGWDSDKLTEEEIEKYPQLLNGFNIVGVFKPSGSVSHGISKLRDREIFVTESSSNVWQEYRDYKWALDRNKNPTDVPEDANNHTIDPIRYIEFSHEILY